MLIVICAIPFAGYVWLQFPDVQTNIAKNALSSVNDSINGTISLDRVTVVFFNKLIAYDLTIIGNDNDTLASIGKLSVAISTQDLLRGRLRANRIVVEDAMFSIATYDIETKDNNISRIFRIEYDSTKVKKPLNLPDMRANTIVLKNLRFKLTNTSRPRKGKRIVQIKDQRCFDPRNIDVSNINARIHRVRYSDGVITCRIRDLSAQDRCGYEVKSLSGFFAMDSSETSIQNLVLTDSYSKIKANYLSFGYESGKDLQEFTQKIVMGGDFTHSTLDFRSIGVFAQSLRDNDLLLDVHGEIIGPVRDLQSKGLELKYKDSTTLNLDIRITGLPKIKNTVFTSTFHDITTNGPELVEIIEDFSKKGKKRKESRLGEILPRRRFSLTGEYAGTIFDGHSEGIVTLDHSTVAYEATILDHFDKNGFDIDASLDIDNLDAGEFISTPILGNVSLNTAARINIGKKRYGGGLSFDIDTLNIRKININDYTYQDIDIQGSLEDGLLNARLSCNDNAFPARLRSMVTFHEGFRPENIKAYIDIPHADLKKTNIVNKRDMSVASILARADITMGADNIPIGNIMLDSVIYANDIGRFVLDSLDIYSYMEDSIHNIELNSPIFTGSYKSNGRFDRLTERLRTDIIRKSVPTAFGQQASSQQVPLQENDLDPQNQTPQEGNDVYYHINLTTHNMTHICQVIAPGLHIAENSAINFNLDGNSCLDFNILSQYIVFNSNKFKDISVSVNNKDSILKADVYIDDISLGNTPLQKSRISAEALSDGLHLNIGFLNPDNTNLALNSIINFDRTANGALQTRIDFGQSLLNIKGHIWSLEPSSITIARHQYTVDNIYIHNDNQSIAIDGKVSEDAQDKIRLDISDFDISLINSFGKRPLGFYGFISGDMELSNIFSSMEVSLSMKGNEIILFDRKFGNITAASRRDQERKRFNILINNSLYGQNPINVSGYFIPERSYMNINMSLDNLQTYYLTPLIENAVEISDGTVTGNINIAGKFGELLFKGKDIMLNSVKFTPKFTNVTYDISGPIDLRERNIDLKQMDIIDPNGSKAVLDGTIRHRNLKDFEMDLGLAFRNLLAINTNEYENDKVYGTAYASGNINVTGGFED